MLTRQAYGSSLPPLVITSSSNVHLTHVDGLDIGDSVHSLLEDLSSTVWEEADRDDYNLQYITRHPWVPYELINTLV